MLAPIPSQQLELQFRSRWNPLSRFRQLGYRSSLSADRPVAAGPVKREALAVAERAAAAPYFVATRVMAPPSPPGLPLMLLLPKLLITPPD